MGQGMTTAWQTASTDAIVIDGTIYRTTDRCFMVRPASRVRLVGYEPALWLVIEDEGRDEQRIRVESVPGAKIRERPRLAALENEPTASGEAERVGT